MPDLPADIACCLRLSSFQPLDKQGSSPIHCWLTLLLTIVRPPPSMALVRGNQYSGMWPPRLSTLFPVCGMLDICYRQETLCRRNVVLRRVWRKMWRLCLSVQTDSAMVMTNTWFHRRTQKKVILIHVCEYNVIALYWLQHFWRIIDKLIVDEEQMFVDDLNLKVRKCSVEVKHDSCF